MKSNFERNIKGNLEIIMLPRSSKLHFSRTRDSYTYKLVYTRVNSFCEVHGLPKFLFIPFSFYVNAIVSSRAIFIRFPERKSLRHPPWTRDSEGSTARDAKISHCGRRHHWSRAPLINVSPHIINRWIRRPFILAIIECIARKRTAPTGNFSGDFPRDFWYNAYVPGHCRFIQ